jgi:tight adherence protein B
VNYIFYLFIVLGFLAVVLFLEALYLIWNAYRGPEAKRIERRLRTMSATHSAGETKLIKTRLMSDIPAMDRALMMVPRIQNVDKLLVQSGAEFTVAKLMLLTLAAAMTGFVLPLILHFPVIVGFVSGLALATAPTLYVISLRNKRLRRFEEQLPNALDLMSRALRAGHAFSGAMQMVGEESPEPVRGEFRTTFEEVNYGIPVQSALMGLANRVPSLDLRYFVIAVLIQRETGGNLSEILDNIAALVRDRLKLFGQIRVLSAEGRLSALILIALPFLVALVISVINPAFIGVLWKDTLGHYLIGGALFMMGVGVLWIQKIIKIRV